MTSDEPRLGAGDVPITLNGQQHVLRPTLDACRKLSRVQGGLWALGTRVAQIDFDAIVSVIRIGLDLAPAGEAKLDLERAVYETGLRELAQPVQDFIVAVGNGGRRPGAEVKTAQADPPSA
jgi:hypothetical protein